MEGLSLCGFVLLSVLFANHLISPTLVEASRHITQASSPSSKSVYIVFTSKSTNEHANASEAYYTQILYRALGSMKAAKDALLYSYLVISGFEAKLTDKQVSLVEGQPEVLEVLKSDKYDLYGPDFNGPRI